MQNQRLVIAGVIFALLLGGAVYALNQREAADAGEAETTPELPAIEREAITRLTITRPESDPIVLEKRGEEWRVTAPVDAEADQSAVTTVLEKLGDLEVTGVAARREENHGRLEVDSAGIRVEVAQGEGEPVVLIVGAYRDRNTMIRVDGQTEVLSVSGSIKYAFNKELKDWRNRRVFDGLQADRIREITFESENGRYAFARTGAGEWAQADGEEPIERFGASKVQSIVASIAGMRAVNFADNADASAAGFDAPTGTVTLGIAPEDDEETDTESADEEDAESAEDDSAEENSAEDAADAETAAPLTRRTISVGGQTDSNEWHVRAQDNPVIYVVSGYLADRMRPDIEKFQNPEPGSEPETPTPPPGAGMPGMPGGPGGTPQIPPELMQQIQQQLQQQGAGGG
ncbi:MAG: DUF4340 domain-containing protein [Myxococcota bacterium]